MAATGIPGSFADPNVEIGGASSGIGAGTNAVFASLADAPMGGSALDKAIGVHTIGEPESNENRKAYCIPGEPLNVLVLKEAEQDTDDGSSLGNRPLNGKPVTNETGAAMKEGTFTFGINAM
jgi:hypothetical protein